MRNTVGIRQTNFCRSRCCRSWQLIDVAIFILLLLLNVSFKNHTSVIIISEFIGEFSSVSFGSVTLSCIHLCYQIFCFRFHHDYAQSFSRRSSYRCLEHMSRCMIVINLVNLAFLTATHSIIANKSYKVSDFPPKNFSDFSEFGI